MEHHRISCIMPTYNRRAFIKQSLQYFEAQDYPHKELIIIDDGTDDISDLTWATDVTCVRVSEKLTIGTKRNIACSLASGNIIAHWDDDDYYGPQRLSKQVQPLLKEQALVTGFRMGTLLNLNEWKAYKVSDKLHAEMFYGNIHGGTLVYWKDLWEERAYPNVQVGEDAQFLRHIEMLYGPTYTKQIVNEQDFVYIRHGRNAWSFATGEHIQPSEWKETYVDVCMPSQDLEFYKKLMGVLV